MTCVAVCVWACGGVVMGGAHRCELLLEAPNRRAHRRNRLLLGVGLRIEDIDNGFCRPRQPFSRRSTASVWVVSAVRRLRAVRSPKQHPAGAGAYTQSNIGTWCGQPPLACILAAVACALALELTRATSDRVVVSSVCTIPPQTSGNAHEAGGRGRYAPFIRRDYT